MPITKKQGDYLRKLIASGAVKRATLVLKKLHPADIADLFGTLTPPEVTVLVELLFRNRIADKVLMELPEGILFEIIDRLDDEKAAELLFQLESNDALLFLEAVPEERRDNILKLLPPAEKHAIEQLLIYPEDSAGYCMSSSYMSISSDLTAQEAVERIREQSEDVDVPFYVYVVDEEGRLTGVVPLRRLVTCPPDTPVRSIMMANPFTVDDSSDREEAAILARKYDIMAIPVVNENHILVGVIPGDSLFDVMEEEATEDMYRMAGLSEEDRIFSPVSTAFRQRFPWIWVNLFTAFVASTVVRAFQGTIESVATLVAFMPIVAGMGGNTGNQSLIVITRGIALGEMEFSSSLKAIFKEARVGLLLGLVAGTAATLVALIFPGSADPLLLGLVIFLAMVGNMGLAGLLGAAIPLILR
ncbi:MAG: magnesium transporter, partial [Candidatus Aegiribacteria sp.]|nr:magnesium transporter [Candidatus Aegiribacteria sp.]MBD3294511.1 magnesium transporter [Candidatus Fermentibacteria bacterium]